MIMANVIYVLITFIAACYLLRWGIIYVINRQRVDMASERKRLQQDAMRGFRINKRATRWLWKLSKYTTPQPPGKNKT
jgi:hypothetical protein